MKIHILQNALACGKRFVAGEIVEAEEKTADILIGAKLAKSVNEPAAVGVGDTVAAPKKKGKKKEGAQK